MTERKWKFGDRVICNDPGYGRSLVGATGVIASIFSYGVNVLVEVEGEGPQILFFHEDEISAGGPTSELDAIERDFKDLFARMRAEIERMKEGG